jgi:hypothetical protein
MEDLMNVLREDMMVAMALDLVAKDNTLAIEFTKIEYGGRQLLGYITQSETDGSPLWILLAVDGKNQKVCYKTHEIHHFLWMLVASETWEEAEKLEEELI